MKKLIALVLLVLVTGFAAGRYTADTCKCNNKSDCTCVSNCKCLNCADANR